MFRFATMVFHLAFRLPFLHRLPLFFDSRVHVLDWSRARGQSVIRETRNQTDLLQWAACHYLYIGVFSAILHVHRYSVVCMICT